MSLSMSPEQFLELAAAYADEDGTIVLFSGGEYDSAQRSFIHLRPEEKMWINLDALTITHETILERTVEGIMGNPWDCLKQKIAPKNNGSPFPEWIGYLAYEMGAYADKDRTMPHHMPAYPAAYFQRGGILIEYDHATQKATVHGALPEKLWRKEKTFHATLEKPLETKERYIEKILKAKELILDGEIYQVNLSHECIFSGISDAFALYTDLLRTNPVPFSSFIRINNTFSIVSLSPERLLQSDGGILETRPIKGTRPRGRSCEEDALLKQQLLSSEKERAELLMITDLMRNDLGKVSKPGSVVTREFCVCESYTAVHHLHSVIQSVPNEDQHPVDLLRACFPGGSITGCPKLRSMEVIDALEQRPRGIYTGSIGYFTGDGAFDFNIAIRTMAVVDGSATLALGGGIVADSDPSLEYEETLHKGKPFFATLSL